MRFSDLSDKAILEELTQRIRQRRLNMNLTQEQVAEKSGLHKQTIKKFESGKNASLLTLIQILRVFDALEGLDQFLPHPGISPVQLLKLKGKERKRASGANLDTKTESEW
ncbi:MAG: helix-turn-helix transcriptional regulator [Bacteroidota bacterium]